MSNSMISTVLEIEREAEAVLRKAEQDAEKIIEDAKAQREQASKAVEATAKKDIAEFETFAINEREKKVKELIATGDAALAAVKNISDAAFNSGVQFVMKALAGK